MISNIMLITIGSTILKAILVNNTSVTGLKELLKNKPLTIQMNDYANFEKVGSIGTTLPRNDIPMNTVPGDVILYQGRNLVIYYGYNSYSLTPIGKIEGCTEEGLKQILGEGSVTVTFSLPESDEKEETQNGEQIDSEFSTLEKTSETTTSTKTSETSTNTETSSSITKTSDDSTTTKTEETTSSTTTESKDDDENTSIDKSDESPPKKNNNKTAIIAGTVSAVAVVVIVVAVTLTCYFKKIGCFSNKAGASESEA